MQSPIEQPFIELAARISKLERYVEALRATEQRGFRGARVYHNANQTFTAGLYASVAFNSEVFDFGDLHDTSTNNSRITVPTDYAGYWFVLASWRWSSPSAAVATNYLEGFLTLNGTAFAQDTRPPNPAGGGSTTGVTLTGLTYATAGDYFQLFGNNGCTTSVDVQYVAGLSPYFMAVRIQT
jgi:hypothetical protein